MSANLSFGEKQNIFLPSAAKIVRIQEMTDIVKCFTLLPEDQELLDFQPGQFLEVSLFGYGEIPIGYASSPTKSDTIDIVVRKVGRVSGAIHNLKEGDNLYLRGPLGNGFPLGELRKHNILIVAGGIGLCPTRSLIQYILDRRMEFKKFTLFYGSRNPSEQLFVDDLKKWKKSPEVTYFDTVDKADENWKGNVGVITKLFRKTIIKANTRVIVCGPPVMYRFVVLELMHIGIAKNNVYVDLERRMKCGIGKCGHCQINDQTVCFNGPVFNFFEAKNLEEAF